MNRYRTAAILSAITLQQRYWQKKKILAANSETMRTAAIRPHLVWGPEDTQIIPRLLERGRQRSLKIVGSGKNLVDISYIDNVAHAHILAAQNLESDGEAGGEAFFISQGEPVVLWDWINELFARLAVKSVRKKVSLTAAYRVGWALEKLYGTLRLTQEPAMTRFLAEQLAMSHWFSIKKAQTVLSFSPVVSTEKVLDKLIDWLST